MAARYTIHDAVKRVLIKDGWTITHDPYTVYRICSSLIFEGK